MCSALLVDNDHLKLIDFGFSKVLDASPEMHMSCGTLSYVAPEVKPQFHFSKNCNPFSLGKQSRHLQSYVLFRLFWFLGVVLLHTQTPPSAKSPPVI